MWLGTAGGWCQQSDVAVDHGCSGSICMYIQCSWTTAHRRPWRFCCFLVSLHWFLQHFVFFSPCLWSVFQSFFLSFQCFFATSYWTFFSEFYTLLMLRCELSSWKFTRSWCYVVNFLVRVLHALDATLWTFFSEFYTLLMLRCELSSWKFTRSWCYVVNFLLRVFHALDATLWTFFSLNLPFESVCHQQKVFVKPGKRVDIGTQVIDRTWLEMKTWLGKYPVSIKKNKHRIKDPTLDKLIFQFVFRQSVLPLNPQGFMSQLRRLLKSNWAPMEKMKGAHGWSSLALHTEHGVRKRWWWWWWWWWWWRGWRRWWRWWRWGTKDEWSP